MTRWRTLNKKVSNDEPTSMSGADVQGKGAHGDDGQDDVVVEQVRVAMVGVERGEGAKGGGVEAHGEQLGDDHGDIVVDEGQRVDGDEVVEDDANIPGSLAVTYISKQLRHFIQTGVYEEADSIAFNANSFKAG